MGLTVRSKAFPQRILYAGSIQVNHVAWVSIVGYTVSSQHFVRLFSHPVFSHPIFYRSLFFHLIFSSASQFAFCWVLWQEHLPWDVPISGATWLYYILEKMLSRNLLALFKRKPQEGVTPYTVKKQMVDITTHFLLPQLKVSSLA